MYLGTYHSSSVALVACAPIQRCQAETVGPHCGKQTGHWVSTSKRISHMHTLNDCAHVLPCQCHLGSFKLPLHKTRSRISARPQWYSSLDTMDSETSSLRLPRYPIEESLQERCPENDGRAIVLASQALSARRAKSDASSALEPNVDTRPARLESVYGDSRDWPKKSKALGIKGAVQYSWSNIGFPHDPELSVQDLEEIADIDREDLNIVALAQDVLNIKNKDARDIADKDTLRTEIGAGRTIELFQLNGRRVAKVFIGGVDARQRGVDYKKLKTAKSFEAIVDREYQLEKPSLETEHRVMTHVLLSRGGQIGGKACDYWKTARNLAQQHIYLDRGLDERLRKRQTTVKKDEALSSMLEMVTKCVKQSAFNPYYQSQRGKRLLTEN